MPSATQFINKGIELISAAVKSDDAGNKQEALKGYRQGVEYLMTAHKYEKNPRIKIPLEAKIGEYIDRAEALRKELSELQQPEKSGVWG